VRLWPAFTALVAILLVACGAVNGNGAIPTPTPLSPPTGALAGWASFPADRSPRPVVLIINASSPGGFTSGDAKIAALCHKFTSGIILPKAVPFAGNVTWSTGTSGIYPSISAAAALTAMRQPGPGTSEPYCATVQALVVTGARFARSEFLTDRGTAEIDSWLFRMRGLNGEMVYPALTAESMWNADMTKGSPDRGSVVSPDGRRLTFSFYGAPATSGPCGADYRAVVAESQAAVAIALQTISHAKPGDLIACTAVAQLRSVDVPLVSVLGGRVVLEETGNVTSVCPVEKPAC
jgi:hypothetical protein